MTKPNRAAGRGASAASLLITAGALAATVGGWYVLASAEQPAADLSEAAPAAQVVPALPPVPTLVPPPAQAAPGAPQAAQPTQPALRRVSPPQPVARTRSSR